MRKIIIFLILITCAEGSAQVINYAIDESFNPGTYFNKQKVTDIIHNTEDNYVIMGDLHHKGGLFDHNGFINDIPSHSIRIMQYKNFYLAYGHKLNGLTFDSGLYTDFKFEYAKNVYNRPWSSRSYHIKVIENDNILVAGRFNTDSLVPMYDVSKLRHLCLIDSTGAPVPDFPLVHCAEPEFYAELWAIERLSNGKYIVAGLFEEINGYDYHNIARLNEDFTVDTTFANVFTTDGMFDIQYIDSQERLWVSCGPGGALKNNPDSLFKSIRLLPSGEVDESFSMPILHTVVGENEDILYKMSPYSILEDDDGTFILGGNFVYANDEYHKTLMKIWEDGSIVQGAFSELGADSAKWGAWIPAVGHIVGTEINKILKLPNGCLLLGGRFSSFGGEPYNCVVKLKPDGFVGLEDKRDKINNDLLIYPNPSNDKIFIKLLNENQKIDKVFIYNSQGVLVKSFNALKMEIDISSLSNGVYFIECHGHDFIYSKKIIKY